MTGYQKIKEQNKCLRDLIKDYNELLTKMKIAISPILAVAETQENMKNLAERTEKDLEKIDQERSQLNFEEGYYCGKED